MTPTKPVAKPARARRTILNWLLIGCLLALGGCSTAPPQGVRPVDGFELSRYLGTWYEIARLDHSFERGLSHVTAAYEALDQGGIRVVNRGYDAADGEWTEAIGKARLRGGASTGSLEVSFFGPFYGGYHVFALADDYRYAMVCGPSKKYLWILSRTPQLEAPVFERLVRRADELGFDTASLIRVAQVDPPARED